MLTTDRVNEAGFHHAAPNRTPPELAHGQRSWLKASENGGEVCPLCRRPFGREGLASGTLTFEGAPPKSYGGKPVALTCRPCNNSSGYMYAFAPALKIVHGQLD